MFENWNLHRKLLSAYRIHLTRPVVSFVRRGHIPDTVLSCISFLLPKEKKQQSSKKYFLEEQEHWETHFFKFQTKMPIIG